MGGSSSIVPVTVEVPIVVGLRIKVAVPSRPVEATVLFKVPKLAVSFKDILGKGLPAEFLTVKVIVELSVIVTGEGLAITLDIPLSGPSPPPFEVKVTVVLLLIGGLDSAIVPVTLELLVVVRVEVAVPVESVVTLVGFIVPELATRFTVSPSTPVPLESVTVMVIIEFTPGVTLEGLACNPNRS